MSIRGSVERLYSGREKISLNRNREDRLIRVTKHHLGIGFELWNAQQTWFWYVDNTNRSAAIGAASSESEAIAETHSSIEELSNSRARPGWECTLGKLARYLASVSDTNV